MKLSKNLTTGAMTTAVETHLRTAHNVVAVPRLIVDWNHNRYSEVTADNVLPETDYGFDIENFPISTIIDPLRPNKGVLKLRVNQGTVSEPYAKPDEPKYYIGSPDDVFKYWTSPYSTDGSGNFPVQDGTMPVPGETTCQPYVLYPAPVKTNKIIIRVENTWANPKNHSVKIRTTVGGSWSTISTAPATPADGVIILYYNGSSWVTTRPSTLVTTNVAAVKFVVGGLQGGTKKDGTPTKFKTSAGWAGGYWTELTTGGAFSDLSLLAIEAHLEVDLSDRLINVSDSKDMSDADQLYPIGTLLTNDGSVTLDNSDGIFNYENSSGPYYGLLEPNAEFNLEYIYTISGVDHSVQQFKMYSGDWQVNDETVEVDIEDYSKFLKAIKPRQLMYENKATTEIIWRLLDSVGFSNYAIQLEDVTVDHKIPIFWTTGEETVWEVLDSLSTATQTAIYFDSNGVLQVKVRDAAYNAAATPEWVVRGDNSGSELADIISLEQTQEFESNVVKVAYKTTKWKVGDYGEPAMSVVWEPDGETMVVRSAPLVKHLGVSDPYLYMGQKDASVWPFESLLQVNGEIIKYRGKQFVYWTGADGNTKNVVDVISHDQYTMLNNSTLQGYRYKNYFTGAFKIVERGAWNTETKEHRVDMNGWQTQFVQNENGPFIAATDGSRGAVHDPHNSIVYITTPPGSKKPDDIFFLTHDTASSSGYVMNGTRIKPGNRQTSRVGMGVRVNGAAKNGYYVEIIPSDKLSNGQREVTLYSRVGRVWKVLDAGKRVAVAKGLWYDLDIGVKTSGGQDTITVWFNGAQVAKATTTNATKQTDSGKIALYARGQSDVTYEYVYGVASGAITPENAYGFYDMKYGGVRGGAWEREQVWQESVRWQRVKKNYWKRSPYRKNLYFFDEFGPYLHEVREFDVKFDPAPVQYSTLFNTNDWYTMEVEYTGQPFGAKFVIANTSRRNAILHGQDSLTYGGASASINQVCVVLGRNLEIDDEEFVTKRNELAVRKRGEVETELTSDWLQSKVMAEEVGEWIVNHWSEGTDELKVEVFGNPLLEVTDVVSISYNEKDMSPSTHKYFVVGISTDFDFGVGTTLTLRRVRD